MRGCYRICICLLAAGAASAQEAGGMGGYNAMRVDRVGTFEGAFDGQIKQMSDGVDITLLSDDPNTKPLPMRARIMKFTWKEGTQTPASIIMEGNVDIQHPQGSIKAGRAEWNFETGELVFTGDPVMNSPLVKDMRGKEIIINFKKNTMRVTEMKAPEVDLQNFGKGESDPSLLLDSDVKDWPGLIGAMKEAADGKGSKPGQRFVSKLDKTLQGYLKTQSTEAIVGQKDAALKQFNKVLQAPDLYEAAAWDGTALTDEATQLLAKETRAPAEQTRLNRLLVEAAYPRFIGSR